MLQFSISLVQFVNSTNTHKIPKNLKRQCLEDFAVFFLGQFCAKIIPPRL